MTQNPDERYLPLPLDHPGIQHLDKYGQGSKQPIRDFLPMAITNAGNVAPARLEAGLLFPGSLAGSTNRAAVENSTARHDSVATTDITNDATYGSSVAGFEALVHVDSDTNIRQREPILPCRILESKHRDEEFYGRENVLALVERAFLPSQDKVM
ncbi:MAG: hypothetical protein Q9170_006928 [Blastenia crenularia]